MTETELEEIFDKATSIVLRYEAQWIGGKSEIKVPALVTVFFQLKDALNGLKMYDYLKNHLASFNKSLQIEHVSDTSVKLILMVETDPTMVLIAKNVWCLKSEVEDFLKMQSEDSEIAFNVEYMEDGEGRLTADILNMESDAGMHHPNATEEDVFRPYFTVAAERMQRIAEEKVQSDNMKERKEGLKALQEVDDSLIEIASASPFGAASLRSLMPTGKLLRFHFVIWNSITNDQKKLWGMSQKANYNGPNLDAVQIIKNLFPELITAAKNQSTA